MGEIAKFLYNVNGTAKRNGADGTHTTVLRLADLGEDDIFYSGTRSVILTDEEIAKYSLSDGDILFIRVNGSKENVGKSYFFEGQPFPVAYCDHLIRCTPSTVLHGKLLSMFMRCGYVRQLIGERMVSAAGQNTISQPSLGTILLPIPPHHEQDRILQKLTLAESFIEQLCEAKHELVKITERAKAKILDLAIHGQLVPQDPADEPASVLLDRIRKEKENLIKQGKIKRDKKETIIFRGDDNSYYEKVGGEVQCIDDNVPFELPEGWSFMRLKSAWELISGRDLSPSEYNDESNGIPYITGASNFENGQISVVRWTPVPQVFTYEGDLLLTCKGTIGEIALNKFGEAHIARQIMAIRNTYNLNVAFLSLCIEWSMEEIKQAAKGLIPGISREDILNLILPVPPVEHQKKIVRCVQTCSEKLNAIFQALS